MGNEFKRRVKGASEQDLYTGWRRVLCYLDNNHGHVRKKIKRSTHRRERRELRQQMEEEW